MDNKLYPPYVDATLPAMIQGDMLVVPFQLNRAVARADFNCMSIVLKTVQTNTVLCNGDPQYASTNIEYDNKTGQWKALFPVGSLVTVGQYYKVQVAFANGHYDELSWKFDGLIGYYSDVSVVKCTSRPNIYIKNLDDQSTSNAHQYEYTGVYSQKGANQDKTEKVYCYRFDLYDEAGELVATSGEQVHNTSLDTEKFESSDSWLVTKNLKPGYWYTVQYTVTTLNNLVVASPAYKVMPVETVDFDICADLSANMIQEDGYVDIRLVPKEHQVKTVRGSFVLVRASDEDDYESWQELYKFDLVNENPDKLLWQDFTVQQGLSYKYALQAYNDNGLYSSKLFNKEDVVYAEFEDMFLFDGERQLNIRYNPKVSSFKTTMLESKMDTLGGQFPFIFRNGNVHYQEFPISGLISMLSDPNELFMKGVKSVAHTAERTRTKAVGASFGFDTHLAGDNFRREREFKMEVLNWLNDGKPKLFRSPGEGNFIVRLMNTSLSPNDTLSRMLHTFSCTAYEIAECNFTNLNKYGFVSAPFASHREMRVGQFELRSLFGDAEVPTIGLAYDFPGAAHFLSISNQYQDELVFDFHFLDGTSVNWDVHNVTGHFNIPINDSPVVKMVFRSGHINEDTVITYGYYDTNVTNNFSYITKVTVEDKIGQYIGGDMEHNIVDDLEDIRLKTGRFYYVKINPRYVYNIFYLNGQYYRDKDGYNLITVWDASALYNVKNASYWLDGSPARRLDEAPVFTACLNSKYYTDLARIDRNGEFKTQGRFEAITNVDDVKELRIGSGVVVDIVYQLKTLEYAVETEDPDTKRAKMTWISAKNEYNTAIENGALATELERLERKIQGTYESYTHYLEHALKRSQEDVVYVV